MKKSIGASMGAAGVPSVSEEVHTPPQLAALASCLHAGRQCSNESVMLQHYWFMLAPATGVLEYITKLPVRWA